MYHKCLFATLLQLEFQFSLESLKCQSRVRRLGLRPRGRGLEYMDRVHLMRVQCLSHRSPCMRSGRELLAVQELGWVLLQFGIGTCGLRLAWQIVSSFAC